MSDNFLPFCKPAIDDSDIDAVVQVLRSGWITTGAHSAALEQAFCDLTGAAHAVAVSSATAALHCYLTSMGIGPGDEVITPSLTWVSTVNLISLCGATPVFVDVNKDTLMVDAKAIEAAITPRTRLIIPVHFAGAPLDLDAIYQVAQHHGVQVLEDAAHALGTRYKGRAVGGDGDAIFSLQAIKNVTAAEGGVFVTQNAELADRIKRLKFHGLGVDAYDRQAQGRNPQAEVIEPGYKYNLPDMCAALAENQLQRLSDINARRRAIAEFYLESLADFSALMPLRLPDWPHTHAWHLFVIRVSETAACSRNALIEALKARQIGCGIHFRAVHQQKYYREALAGQAIHLPNTEWNSERICSIPLFPHMQMADAERVVDALKSILSVV